MRRDDDTLWQTHFLEEISDIIGGKAPCRDAKDASRQLRTIADSIRSRETLDFEEIGDHLYDGVYIADGQGKTLYVNKAYQRITGLTKSEVVGFNVQDLVDQGLYRGAVTPEVIRLKKQVHSVGESRRNNVKMLITGNPIFDEAGNVKLVAVIEREMTDLVQMQFELEATQRKMRAVEDGQIRKRQEIEHLRRQVMTKNLVGASSEMAAVAELIRSVAAFDVTVLICGETGVGKEVVANEIHLAGSRQNQPFIKVNCAAIPSSLLEAELFGYEKGAFTGAASGGKLGLFELADKGTLLLDEIGDMPLELQCKLLRFLQEKEVIRVGGTRPIRLDVRILAATNRDLRALVRDGKFREDLFYRLSVFPISIPALRHRPGDVSTLTAHFLALYNAKYAKAVRVDRDGLDVMREYSWPGNVRELQNVVERLVLISSPDAIIGAEQMMVMLNLAGEGKGELALGQGLKPLVDDLERRTIERALSLCGSTRKAARLLKIDQSTIVKKAKRLGIRISDEICHRVDDDSHQAAMAL